MRSRMKALALAGVAAAAPAAALVVADVTPAAAGSCPSSGSWNVTREVPLKLFDVTFGKTAVQMGINDFGCDGGEDTVSSQPIVTITHAGLTQCGTSPTAASVGPDLDYGFGPQRGYDFYFSLNGGPCTLWNSQKVDLYSNGNTSKAKGLMCWHDVEVNCKETD